MGKWAKLEEMTSEQIDALWTIDNPVKGFEELTKALAEHPESADELHTQICRSLGLQGKFDEAWAELGKVSAQPSEIVKVRLALESGRLKNSSGDKKAAEPYFLSALAEAEKHGFDFYAVDAAHMLGIVTAGEASLDWNERAIAMAAKSSDKRAQGWQGSLLNNVGWTYHDMGEYEKALDKFKAALAYRESVGGEVRIRIGRWAVARCLRSLKRYDEALAIQLDLIQFPEQGYVSEELGELLLAVGRVEEAKPHFAKAYEMLSPDPFLKVHQAERLERLKVLSE